MAVVSPEGGGGLPEARPFALAPPAVERGRGCLGGGAGPGVRRRAVPAGPGARGGGGHRPVPRRVGVFRRRGGAGGGAAEDPDGSGAGPGPALPLPARGPAGHEPRLRAPHPQEPAGPGRLRQADEAGGHREGQEAAHARPGSAPQARPPGLPAPPPSRRAPRPPRPRLRGVQRQLGPGAARTPALLPGVRGRRRRGHLRHRLPGR